MDPGNDFHFTGIFFCFTNHQKLGCEILFVAYGTPSRITRAAIRLLEAEGIKAGLLRPITLWPFPSKALKQAAMQDSVKAVVDVELSMGQMIDDVKIALEGCRPVSFWRL